MPQQDLSLHYAIEIEAALVTLCWHHPEVLPKVLQNLNPLVHISQPHLRHLLEAINRSYSELGATDWAATIDCLTDLGLLAECGEALTLDELYKNPGCSSLLDYYIERLQEFAVHRNILPGVFPSRFSGGFLTLSANPIKRKPTDPDLVGTASVAGKPYTVRGWSDSGNLNCRLYPGTAPNG